MSGTGDGAIAIVGAGLAGLVAAVLLCRDGRAVTLYGPPASSTDTRTTAILEGGVRLLEGAGVWDGVRSLAAPLKTMRIVDATARLLRAPPVSFDAASAGLEAFGWNVANVDLVRALEARLADRPGFERRAVPVRAVRDDSNRVEIDLAEGETTGAQLVVAADGRNSLVRQAIGIGTRTWSYPQVALAQNLRHARPHCDTSTEFHTEGGPITLVPLPGLRSSLVGVVPAGEAERLGGLADDAFALEIERRCHSILGRFEVDGPRSFWPLSGLAAQGLTKGRTVLVGEAAHMIPPIGAQGFNLTMRDIAALSEAVAGLPDPGDPAALAAYERSRRADVTTRTAAVDLLNRSLLSDFLPVQIGRSLGLYLLDRIEPLRGRAVRLGLASALRP